MDITCGGELVVLEPVSGSIPIEEPATCPACGSPTTRTHRGKEGAVIYCSKPDSCAAATSYRIKHYIGTSKKGLGILGIGDSVLQALIEAELVKSPADLYRLTVGDIEDLQIGTNAGGKPIRLGGSRAGSIIAEISKAKQVSLAKFLGALGVDLLGRRRVEILAEECDLRTLEDWMDSSKLALIPGDTTRKAIVAGMLRVLPIIKDLLGVGVEVSDFGLKPTKPGLAAESIPPGPISDNPFAGHSFCFTGTRAHQDEVEARGGIIKSGVSKNLDLLIQKDATSHSNKTKKAESYGVKIISIATLELILRGERGLP